MTANPGEDVESRNPKTHPFLVAVQTHTATMELVQWFLRTKIQSISRFSYTSCVGFNNNDHISFYIVLGFVLVLIQYSLIIFSYLHFRMLIYILCHCMLKGCAMFFFILILYRHAIKRLPWVSEEFLTLWHFFSVIYHTMHTDCSLSSIYCSQSDTQ